MKPRKPPADVLDRLLRESLTVVQDAGALSKRDMEAVAVDTTVQEKAVRFPTDAALLYTALTKLGIEARLSGIKLRQSYVRVGKRAQIMAGVMPTPNSISGCASN